MFKKTSYLLPLAILGACAYGIDGSIQDVKFVTPGAHGAACNVYVEGLKYKVKPPQELNLYKSKEDLVVDCMAPGNRRKIIYIEPEIETSTAWNITNAGVGVPWDYASGALFRYPDVIEIDFTNEPVTDPPPPAQNSPDIRQPEEYILEEFSASEPMLNKDRNAPPVEILRRGSSSATHGMEGAMTIESVETNDAPVLSSEPVVNDGTAFSEPAPAGMPIGKGTLVPVEGGTAQDGGLFVPSVSDPIPLLPGE